MEVFKNELFKDFKEDLSQAVNELVPGEDATEAAEQDNDVVVNTLEDELDVESELSKLDGLLEKVTKDANAPVEKEAPAQETETKVETPAAEEKEDLHIQEESKMSETTANENHDNARRDSNTGTAGNSGTFCSGSDIR